MKKERRRVQLVCRDPSLTRQSEAASCDVNKIVERFKRTGILPPVARQGFYADVAELGGYREVLDRVEEARGYFSQLPAATRAEFNNDPAAFLDYVATATVEELAAKGLSEEAVDEPSASGDKASEVKGTGS